MSTLCQRFSVQVGTGAKAPPPCEQVPAALLVELVLLPVRMRRLFWLLAVLRTELLSVRVPEHLQCLPLIVFIPILREQPRRRWYTLANGNASGNTGSPCSCCQQRKRVCNSTLSRLNGAWSVYSASTLKHPLAGWYLRSP